MENLILTLSSLSTAIYPLSPILSDALRETTLSVLKEWNRTRDLDELALRHNEYLQNELNKVDKINNELLEKNNVENKHLWEIKINEEDLETHRIAIIKSLKGAFNLSLPEAYDILNSFSSANPFSLLTTNQMLKITSHFSFPFVVSPV